MTANQPPPARPDGDALAAKIQRLLYEGIDPVLSKEECEFALARIRATSPAHDAAEGGRKMVSEIPFDPTNHHNALKCPYCNPEGLTFAPPKPALDAVREARENQLDVLHRYYRSGRYDLAETVLDAILAFSAPVPPADGVPHIRQTYSGEPPLAAGAAEPVAWPDHPGATVDAVAFVEANKRYPQIDRDSVTDLNFADKQADRLGAFIEGFKRAILMRALPPVRGEREILDRLYREKIEGIIDQWTAIALERKFASSWHYGELWKQIRDALPVQPGAGEREAVIEECAKLCETHAIVYRGTEPYKLVSSDSGEPIGTLFANAIRKFLSRQPPQSSSDGGGRD